MSSVSSSLSSQYYQLANTGTNTSSNSSSSSSALTTTLASYLQAADTTDTSSSVSDLLDLSPTAQGILDGLNGTGATTPTDTSSSFTLTSAQQQQVTAILTKYQNAPQTQATYDAIQNDLSAAGLGPQQLATEDSINSFSATQVLVSALSGNSDPITSDTPDDATEQSKSANYMTSIVNQWKAIAAAAGNLGTGDTVSASASA